MADHVKHADLTEPELAVLRCFAGGDVLRLPDGDGTRSIRGAFLSGLLTGLYRVRPTGIPALRLIGARVTGELNLEAAEVRHLIDLRDCRFDGPVELQMSRITGLRMTGCRMPALSGRNMCVDSDLVLEGGFRSDGVVDLTDGEVRGTLRLADAVLRGSPDHALLAARLKVSGSVQATRLQAFGEVRLRGAEIGGSLHLTGARLGNMAGCALEASGLVVTGNLFCDTGRNRFVSQGRIMLTGARIGGDAVFSGARLAIPVTSERHMTVIPSGELDADAALVADRIRIEGNLELDDDLRVVGSLRLPSAEIGGHLHLSGATLGRPASVATPPAVGPSADSPRIPVALLADGVRIGGDLEARARVGAANGNESPLTAYGQVRLVDASIRGNARLTGGRLHGRGLDVLLADRLHVGGSLFLQHLVAEGSVRLQNAQIGSSLDCTGARLTMPRCRQDGTIKPSLDARVAVVGKDLLCSRGFVATGGVRVRLVEAGKRVSFHEATLGGAVDRGRQSTATPALNAYGLSAPRFVFRFGVPPKGSVILTRAKATSVSDAPELWAAEGGVELEDFAFESIAAAPPVTVRTRLGWLRRVLPSYLPWPYEQLARSYRESGDDEQADRVLFAKQKRRFAALGPVGRLWGRLQEFTVGYGYRPWLAGCWLVLFWLGGAWWFEGHRMDKLDDGQNPVWNPWLLSADLLLPVVNLGHDGVWRIDGSSQWTAGVLTAAGWILASTAAAGTTRVLKRG
ncbi:cytoskeletal protein CcmA (bactofilin family) [Actinoalloteichus hoggarensis]|uniref:Uncharacterized protein n=1 Tax=Actinoalloteichus hoggarensis TaxID=1470176 RepID=A0A221WD12_9PSEU|nr:hypothetical protein [Actinoalloteichus hoggarensis]ASO23157.1 hypothetical protein AHOG_27800 [Actinoalloteichus hoggarensis]MBB5922761.1 cytoskeletal protein CcmA (bactofilin family) [Actinoalloteichus hoggarensis]